MFLIKDCFAVFITSLQDLFIKTNVDTSWYKEEQEEAAKLSQQSTSFLGPKELFLVSGKET